MVRDVQQSVTDSTSSTLTGYLNIWLSDWESGKTGASNHTDILNLDTFALR